ncbi:PREDICTED: protein MCM10 homolog [Diuraphis noxia]|uniref:protein MCM10 homolog n=1 Tax=Diuraphis noxia TaxID=143948 RepID=UPI0007638F59|nr:PREDICTED: protein MCM10 homolog [Diuraphis noxia]XP_015370486.1 PREDICTED: protein MCM10 homolog [Diuraphis noxia]XP_015370487.1 PREDICTED: protein MCM10 homolog [Diuraphis noxia]
MSSDMNSNDDDLKALALFLDAEIDANPTTEKITDSKQDEIKDNKDNGNQPAENSGKETGSFSDFFKSMKSKVVDLDEEVVKCEPKKNSIPKKPKFGFDPSADPVFGLCMINPLLSSQTIQDRMIGKVPVPVGRVKTHLKSADDSDWVVAGVLVNKSLPKTSQKGSTFSIWKISDLKPGMMSTITIFLFGRSHADLWKTDVGFVVGILNPKEMDGKDKKDEIALSINSGDQVMLWGRSKDYGTCKGVKKNGEKCDMFVNINNCDVCTFHVKREYIKHCSQRANIGNSRPTAAHSLRDKILGKNEVFYGGQSFVSTKSNHSKLMKEDQVKLQRLKSTKKLELGPIESLAAAPRATIANRRATAIKDFVNGLKTNEISGSGKKNIDHKEAPKMCTFKDILGSSSNLKNVGSMRPKCAKANALNWIKSNGTIQKENPNLFEKSKGGRKRKLPEDIVLDLGLEKKVAVEEKVSPRFLELMKATSQNQDLIDTAQQEAEDKYFDQMDKKEKMEHKMMNTYKMPCKAVRCLVCKYTWFSASEWCKTEKHALRVMDATKRFFKCNDCNSRIACLTMFPMISCKNCNGSKWERAPMMSHKKVDEIHLSIRGDEQTFLSSMQPKLSMSLMVAEED